jgi:hypothetical protein
MTSMVLPEWLKLPSLRLRGAGLSLAAAQHEQGSNTKQLEAVWQLIYSSCCIEKR